MVIPIHQININLMHMYQVQVVDDNTFKISIVVDSESPIDSSIDSSTTTLSAGSSFPNEICFDFDSSNPSFTPIISYNPIRGRSITFNIMVV